ncbi:hypothetical protein TNCV_398991 [Trichonephila clavipes]|uniref:Uncharacterized protein n=1 Tax=Trichonephila clavipes TaxID=2585209 RepID=A0A8X6VTV1_TRICX|nr:hypothetical protein TNCV_398991 [Trichonephila clavipes]
MLNPCNHPVYHERRLSFPAGSRFSSNPSTYKGGGRGDLRTILDRVLGARAAGVHYRLFSVWTLVPVRLDQQLSDHSTVDEIASRAADCRLTYTMANCPQRRKGKKKKRTRKEGKRARKRQGLVVLGSGEENPRVLLGDADQESETRMRKKRLADWTETSCGVSDFKTGSPYWLGTETINFTI